MHRSKICFKCKTEKPLSDFYKHNKMFDGHLNKCKECARTDVRSNRVKRIDYYREYDRERGNRQGPEYLARMRDLWPQQYHAHIVVSNALRDKKLTSPHACSNCGAISALHGHHDDYLDPLVVRWLCPACHSAWHKEHGPGKNRRAPF